MESFFLSLSLFIIIIFFYVKVEGTEDEWEEKQQHLKISWSYCYI